MELVNIISRQLQSRSMLLAFGFCCSGFIVHANELHVEPTKVNLFVGGTQQLLVAGTEATAQDFTTTAQYSSSDNAIATVSNRGVVHGHFRGHAAITIQVAGQTRNVPLSVSAAEDAPEIRFVTEVLPILTRLGCNSGECHGKATGQNGFKLSLFGSEPDGDYDALAREGRGRRLFPTTPDSSLLLLKATAKMPHGGGRRMEESSDDYRILRQWILRGAIPPRDSDPRLERIELSPREERILPTTSSQQLLVTAHFSDGSSRDVTRQSVFQSNETGIAMVDPDGLINTTSQHGLVTIMARFSEQILTFHAAVPFAGTESQNRAVQLQLNQLERQFDQSPYDLLLLRQWRRMNVVPSPPADDATFLRRVMIDLCGTLPTAEEIQDYVTDQRTDKRARLIQRLLNRPEYASYFTLMWSRILQNRGSRAGTTLFTSWIRDSLASNKRYDQFVSEILTASGNQNENPPAIWYRAVRKSSEYVESVAQAFLGVRIQCAQCHHHPTEHWSQSDYYGLAAVFSRVGRKGGFADGEVPTDEIIYLKESGHVVHPRTGVVLRPQALGGAELPLGLHDDPRSSLARWMTDAKNPYFARTMVNRLWAHFLSRGIVQPIDDARSTNPPSNPELLDALADDFISSGYDVKHLISVIASTYAYGLESASHAGNEGDSQTFARFYPRRLSGEVLLDGISQVLDVPTEFVGGPGKFPLGTRAIDLPDDNFAAHFLDVFGRSAKMSSCNCERSDAPALSQALEIVNSVELQRKLTSETGYAIRLAKSQTSDTDLATEIFLRALARPPRSEELQTAVDYLHSASNRSDACESLLWSLLATNEFLFNH
jgi:hypothetical protein